MSTWQSMRHWNCSEYSRTRRPACPSGRGFNGANVISDDNWSEGNGWGAFALSILVRDLPEQHPKREAVVQLAKSFYAAVLKHQNEDGMWHQEMTDETSYVETSGSGLLLYGLGIMIEKGLLDPRTRRTSNEACAAIWPISTRTAR